MSPLCSGRKIIVNLTLTRSCSVISQLETMSSILDKRHVPCRVIQVFGTNYRLYCQKGVLKGKYSSHQLMPLSSDIHIPLEDWRLSAQVHLHKLIHDSTCLQFCDCVLDVSSTNSTVPLEVSDAESERVTESLYWIRNALYSGDREVISPSAWLSDKIIAAAQLLVFQQYPEPAKSLLQFPSSHQRICTDRSRLKESLVYYFKHWLQSRRSKCRWQLVHFCTPCHSPCNCQLSV